MTSFVIESVSSSVVLLSVDEPSSVEESLTAEDPGASVVSSAVVSSFLVEDSVYIEESSTVEDSIFLLVSLSVTVWSSVVADSLVATSFLAHDASEDMTMQAEIKADILEIVDLFIFIPIPFRNNVTYLNHIVT